MARIRTIKPEYWTDPAIVALPYETRLFYIGMWNFADDYGCVEDEPARLKLQIMPADDIDPAVCIRQLVDGGQLERCTSQDGDTFLRIRSWERHQKVDKRSVPRFGDPAGWTRNDPSPAESRRVPPSPAEGSARKGREGKGREETPLSTDVDQDDDLEDQFQRFWDAWPKRNGKKIGRRDALTKWKRLTLPERRAAYIGARHYAAASAHPDIAAGAMDAHRWLARRLWDDWQEPATPDTSARDGPARASPPVYDSPEWHEQQRRHRETAERVAGRTSQ